MVENSTALHLFVPGEAVNSVSFSVFLLGTLTEDVVRLHRSVTEEMSLLPV